MTGWGMARKRELGMTESGENTLMRTSGAYVLWMEIDTVCHGLCLFRASNCNFSPAPVVHTEAIVTELVALRV